MTKNRKSTLTGINLDHSIIPVNTYMDVEFWLVVEYLLFDIKTVELIDILESECLNVIVELVSALY